MPVFISCDADGIIFSLYLRKQPPPSTTLHNHHITNEAQNNTFLGHQNAEEKSF